MSFGVIRNSISRQNSKNKEKPVAMGHFWLRLGYLKGLLSMQNLHRFFDLKSATVLAADQRKTGLTSFWH